jgi:hypothetical protein
MRAATGWRRGDEGDDDSQAIWEMNAGAAGADAFSPLQVSAVSGWLRLAASTAVSGEWPTVVDTLNAGSPMVQTAAVRKAAVGTSVNGLPTMVFDGTDVHLWPQNPSQISTTKIGIWAWFKPASLVSTQYLYCVIGTVAGAPFHRFRFGSQGSAFVADFWQIDGSNARTFVTASGFFTVGSWTAAYLQYDSSRGGDPNVAVYKNGVLTSTSNSDIGGTIGPTGMGVLLGANSGNATVGAFGDSDAPSGAILNGGEIGPNVFAFNNNLTTPQIAAFMTFEAPT